MSQAKREGVRICVRIWSRGALSQSFKWNDRVLDYNTYQHWSQKKGPRSRKRAVLRRQHRIFTPISEKTHTQKYQYNFSHTHKISRPCISLFHRLVWPLLDINTSFFLFHPHIHKVKSVSVSVSVSVSHTHMDLQEIWSFYFCFGMDNTHWPSSAASRH